MGLSYGEMSKKVRIDNEWRDFVVAVQEGIEEEVIQRVEQSRDEVDVHEWDKIVKDNAGDEQQGVLKKRVQDTVWGDDNRGPDQKHRGHDKAEHSVTGISNRRRPCNNSTSDRTYDAM